MVHEVVAALIVQSEMILLGRRSGVRLYYPDVWDLFGGHVEPGEHPEQTLVRELQEEIGITPTHGRTWKLSICRFLNSPRNPLIRGRFIFTLSRHGQVSSPISSLRNTIRLAGSPWRRPSNYSLRTTLI